MDYLLSLLFSFFLFFSEPAPNSFTDMKAHRGSEILPSWHTDGRVSPLLAGHLSLPGLRELGGQRSCQAPRPLSPQVDATMLAHTAGRVTGQGSELQDKDPKLKELEVVLMAGKNICPWLWVEALARSSKAVCCTKLLEKMIQNESSQRLCSWEVRECKRHMEHCLPTMECTDFLNLFFFIF